MQNNAPCHTSKLTRGWLDQQNFLTMTWTAYSPGINPIKHIWAGMKACLHKEKGHIIKYSDLEREIRKLWDEVDCAMLENVGNVPVSHELDKCVPPEVFTYLLSF